MDFEIKLPLFKGPFDLLLFFIERDELDINDIPISKITEDFLSYIEELEQLNIEVASEFILVAASLMRIKARLLVPRPDIDEEGNEVDPREELIQRLLEYKKYKTVVQTLTSLENIRLQQEKRGNVLEELKLLASQQESETELESIDLYKLLKVYQKVIARFEQDKNNPKHQVIEYPYSISDQKEFIISSIKLSEKLSFEEIIIQFPNKIAVIFNFLSILELLQLNIIKITIGDGFNNFWLEPGNEFTPK